MTTTLFRTFVRLTISERLDGLSVSTSRPATTARPSREPDVEVLFRQRFRRDLRAGRFTMEFAQSGPAALQRISDAVDVSLILILSDINMPGMSGLELLPKAKALRPDVPVIMITAYGDAETKRKALENGAEALLTKPIDFITLRSEIDMRVEGAV